MRTPSDAAAIDQVYAIPLRVREGLALAEAVIDPAAIGKAVLRSRSAARNHQSIDYGFEKVMGRLIPGQFSSTIARNVSPSRTLMVR
jgi:hypothetical protein